MKTDISSPMLTYLSLKKGKFIFNSFVVFLAFSVHLSGHIVIISVLTTTLLRTCSSDLIAL